MTVAFQPRGLYLVVAFGILAAAAVIFILTAGQGTGFWHDDCDFLHHRSLTDPWGLFIPHNDHAVVLPAIAYRAVADVAGTGSYMPFLALVQVAHIATAAGLFAVLQQRSAWLALGAAALLLFLGSGADNLFWAFQITFLGSTAFGVAAIWSADRDRWPLAGVLLVGSVFCSLVGVAFVVAASAIGASRRRREAWWLALPTVLLSAWWWIFARSWERPPDWATYAYGSPLSGDSWSRVPAFVFEAALRSVAHISGLNLGLVFLVMVIGIATALIALRRGWRPSPLQLGALLGFLAFATMVGVIRAANAIDFGSRYQYVAAVFGLLMLPTVRPGRLPTAAAVLLLSIALVSNISAFGPAQEKWTARADGILACQP